MNTGLRNLHEEIANSKGVHFLSDVDFSDGVCEGTIPQALIICCSEMGMSLPYIGTSENVYVLQNFGHHCCQHDIANLLAQALVTNLIVYGHSNCAFTKFLFGSLASGTPENRFLAKSNLIDGAQGRRQEIFQHFSGDNWLLGNELNVLADIGDLLAWEEIESRIQLGELKLHGWMYEETTRRLEVFNPELARFIYA